MGLDCDADLTDNLIMRKGFPVLFLDSWLPYCFLRIPVLHVSRALRNRLLGRVELGILLEEELYRPELE